MKSRKVQWGILGAANIARKNWKGIRNTGNSTVTAVASRDVERANRFIAECQLAAPMETAPRACSYEEILKSSDVDAVYIPLPTGLRKEWVLRAAEAGKHVLCEKPCGMTVADLRQMIDACKRNKVQFMDGVMFMHSMRLPKMREALDKELGQIKRISSAFSFLGSEEFFTENIRTKNALEPLGALGDLGWYCIRFGLWAMNGQLPRRVTGRTLNESRPATGSRGVPLEFSGELFFDGGVSSGFYCSFLTEIEQWAEISTTNGLLRLDDFVLPFFGSDVSFELIRPNFNVNGCDFHMEPHKQLITIPEYSNSQPGSQEANLFKNFADTVLSGRLNDFWPEIALKTQLVVNACFESAANGASVVEVPMF